jgi:DNA-directed RNA polymerase subunit RPC12/RpoP
MPIYACPKCGRTVEKPEGTYYCSKCGPEVLMVEKGSLSTQAVPKKVYVVLALTMSSEVFQFIGVFTSKKLAEEAEQRWKKQHPYEYGVAPVTYEVPLNEYGKW